MRCRIGVIFVVCALVSGILAGLDVVSRNVSAGSWNIEIVDSGSWFRFASLALDSNGNPNIGYYNAASTDLKHAWWNGSAWESETIDSTGDVGQYASIAMDGSNLPHIGYFNASDHTPKYARWDGSKWSIEKVDESGNGSFLSIAVDGDGYGHLSYNREWPLYDLRYAGWNGSRWNTQTVDSAGDVGFYTSIALNGSGYPRISYQGGAADLKYAEWNGSAWLVQTVDPVGVVGEYTSLALDSKGYPHISYRDIGNENLKYAAWNGTSWNVETVDSTRFVGSHNSLAMDSSDHPHISYYDGANKAVKYAWWNGSAWSFMTVAALDSADYTSLKIDTGGQVHIAFCDQVNGLLKYATWLNARPETPDLPSGPVSGIVGISYAYSTSATDPDGDQVKYTFDWGDGNTSETGYVGSGSPGFASHAWDFAGTYDVTARATDSYGSSSGWSAPIAVAIAGPPGAPTGLTASPGDGLVNLSWSPPADDGGSPITNYTIFRGSVSGGETPLLEIGNILAHADSGLQNGQTYYYWVSAKNVAGEGSPSNEANATPTAPPGPPIGLVATGGDANVTLNWSPPVDDGGSQIVNYSIRRGMSPGGETPLVTVGNILAHLDTGLTNGQTYYYTVAAVNAVGEGQQSNEANALPATVPSEPLNLQASPSDSQITLTWETPVSNGGLPISNYRAYRGTSPGGETFLTEVGAVLILLDSGLVNGQQYCYTVTAVNDVGEGLESNEACATPSAAPTVPSAPQNLQAVAGDSQVVLTWAAPVSDGGLPIVNYVVHRGLTPGGEIPLITIPNILTYVDSGLTNGQMYYYTVAAKNAIGHGGNSTEVSAMPASTPSEPLNLEASPGNGQVVLTWQTPIDGGGSPVTNYVVYRGLSSGSETILIELGNVLTHTDIGLTNGQTYFYKVSAKNAVGEGPQSNEASATPSSSVTTPTAPLNLQASPGNGQVMLAWSAPASDGGSPITNFVVYKGTSPGGETRLSEIGNVLTHTDTGLMNGQTYYYQVAAKNAVGEGSRSSEASATPATVPNAPDTLVAVAGDAQVALTWAAPVDDGGSAVTSYRVHRGTASGGETLLVELGDILTYTDMDVVNGQTYYFTVGAINAIGEGPQSNEANATPSPPQNQPPLCAITAPVSDEIISGTYLIAGTASDPDGSVEYVEVRTDDGNWTQASGNSSWTLIIDTTSYSDGSHTIYARSYDGAAYSSLTNVSVMVKNDASQPPEGSLFEQTWFWIIIVIVIALAIVALVLLLKRRRETESRDESALGHEEDVSLEDEEEAKGS